MKSKTTILLIVLLLGIVPLTTHAQNCTPDPLCSSEMCPDSITGLPSVTPGVMYSEVITVAVPSDTTAEFPPGSGTFMTLNVDSLVVTGLTGLPPGLSYTCEPPSCTWFGGISGCILISGISSDTGTYNLIVNYVLYVTEPVFGISVQVFDSTTYYSIVVGTPVTPCTINSSFAQSAVDICVDDAVSFINTGDATGSCGIGCPTFSWDYGDGNTFSGTDASAANPTHTYAASGTYTITLITADGSCGDTSTTTVVVSAGPSIDLVTSTDASSCGATDGTINITASGGVAPLQYSINGGVTFVATNGFSGLSPGNYSIAVSDVVGCIVSGNSESISAPGSPIATAGVDGTVCTDGSYMLSGTMGGTASSITWTTSGTGTFDDDTSLTASYSPSSSDSIAGNVTLTITTDDPDGGGPCQAAMDNLLLTISSGPGQPDITFAGNAFASSSATTYQWFLNGDSISGETGQFYVATESGFYTVVIGDAMGCTASSSVLNHTLGIHENQYGLSVAIYPNPSSGKFIIETSVSKSVRIEHIRILNMMGQIAYEAPLSQNTGIIQKPIDLAAFGAGLYNLQLLSKGETILSRKIILEK